MDYNTKSLPKKHFTKEQIEHFRAVNTADFMNWYQPGSVVLLNGSYRLKNDHSMVFNGIWARDFSAPESSKQGQRNPVPGLDAVMQLCSLNFYQAACAINDFFNAKLPSSCPPVETALTRTLLQKRLEDRTYENATNSWEVFAYLTKTRHIHPEVVKQNFRNGNIYVEKLPKGYNILFPMYDCDVPTEDEIVGFERCGILSNKDFRYKGSITAVPNEYFDIWFSIPQANCKAAVYVFESAIDALSFQSLVHLGKLKLPEDKTIIFLSLRGVHFKILEHFLINTPETDEIVLCVDADEAGDNLCKQVEARLKDEYMISQMRTPLIKSTAKDWNEVLRVIEQNLESTIGKSPHIPYIENEKGELPF